jgi:hypothetical protein
MTENNIPRCFCVLRHRGRACRKPSTGRGYLACASNKTRGLLGVCHVSRGCCSDYAIQPMAGRYHGVFAVAVAVAADVDVATVVALLLLWRLVASSKLTS